MNYPSVIGEFETVDTVLTGKSIARYGDGELKLMDVQGYSREPPCFALADELYKIFRRPNKKCLVGIPTMSPDGPKYFNWLRHQARFLKMVNPDMQYYSAFITRPDSAPWINTIDFATKFESIWRDRRVTVMSENGNSILKAVRLSTKVTPIRCPSRQAYAEIDRLEDEIVATEPDVALLSCGPTATCLAHRLAMRGIHAVDIGSAGGYLLKLLTGTRVKEYKSKNECSEN